MKSIYYTGLSFIVLGFSNCFSVFYTVYTERELQQKINQFVVVFAVFAEHENNETGKFVKAKMRKLSQDSDFNETSGHELKFCFLFVKIDTPHLKEHAQSLGYSGNPLFVLYDSKKLVAKSDFMNATNKTHYYTVRGFKKFIHDKVGKTVYDPKIDDELE